MRISSITRPGPDPVEFSAGGVFSHSEDDMVMVQLVVVPSFSAHFVCARPCDVSIVIENVPPLSLHPLRAASIRSRYVGWPLFGSAATGFAARKATTSTIKIPDTLNVHRPAFIRSSLRSWCPAVHQR